MPGRKLNSKIIQKISLLLGLALFFYLIYSVGAAHLLESIKLVGFGFVLLIILSGARHLLRTIAWFYCIEEEHRQIKLFKLFNIRLAGEAVRLLSFVGPVLSETSKAMLMRRHLPTVSGMSSIIIENLAYTLGTVLVIISGLVLFAANYAVQNSIKILGIALCILMLALIFCIKYFFSKRKRFLTPTTRILANISGSAWLKSKVSSAAETERKVHDFYNRRGFTFLLVLFFELAAHLTNILEIYLILSLIAGGASLLNAYIIESVTKIVNILFFFVPGQIGVAEGGNAVLFKVLGMSAATGVALALIEKIRTIFWVAYGLTIWTVINRGKPAATDEYKTFASKKISAKGNYAS